MKWLNYFLIAFSLFFSIFFFEKFGKHNNIFYGDALGYYSYLPTTFIYHNVTNLDSDDVKNPMPVFLKDYINAGAYDNPKTPLGKTIIQYHYFIFKNGAEIIEESLAAWIKTGSAKL